MPVPRTLRASAASGSGEWVRHPIPIYVLGRACSRDSRGRRRLAALQHLDRPAGAGGAGGAGGALAAALADREAAAQQALAGGDGAGPAGLAAGDRRAAAGAADRRPAVPGQRPDPAALARVDEAGGGAGAARDRSPSPRSSPASPGSPGRRPSGPPTTRTPRRSPSPSPSSRSRSRCPTLLRGRAAAAGFLAVLSAGCGYAWTAIASKLLTDELAAGALLVAAAWLATAIASEGLALLSEMSALQSAPGDPRGAGDVRRPGARPGAPGAADLRRVLEHDPARRGRPRRLHGASRSPAPSCSPARRRSAP